MPSVLGVILVHDTRSNNSRSNDALTLTLTQFISDNNDRITQMWLKYNYTFTITNEIKITHFTIQVIDEAFCS